MPPFMMRDATEADLSKLVNIRQPEALHRGRLRDAANPNFRYFVMFDGQEAVGFVSLVFSRPQSWINKHDTHHLPEVNDLYIAEDRRGQGYGSQAIQFLERVAAEAGYKELYISVESRDNPRAYALYQRLGYQQLQAEPYFHQWGSLDGDGILRQGDLWLVDMVKPLST
ncbi:MAG: GNAT family N-acetyltransferase [Anaerolineaceae bacterium]|nr:GNAT family N-acetyltransferase [Anaerolineaceae bacterium]